MASKAHRTAVPAALVGLSVVLGVLASVHPTFPGDGAAGEVARGLGPDFGPVAGFFNEWFSVPAAVSGVVAAGLLVRRREAVAAALVLFVMLARPLLMLGKAAVDRPRPSGDFPVLDVVTDSSFPSGHTMTAVTFLGIWFVFAPLLVPPRWVWTVRAGAAAGVVLMALSRMWAGVHWLSDTYGAVIWVAAVFAVGWALAPRLVEAASRLGRAVRVHDATRATAEDGAPPGG